jgi:glycosyltransferase involved in cell wall biosynthesis
MITVVIPAYNEQESVGRTVEEMRAALAAAGEREVDLVVVDDGSQDGTAAEAEAAGARVVSHPHNLGYGRSLKDGIAAGRYDTVLICDADGSYGLERLPELLAARARGFELVVGMREGYRESPLKALLRWALKLLVEFTTGRRIPDVNSGLRLFSRADSMPRFRHLSDTFSFTTSQTLAYLMSNQFVAYVPVAYRRRVGRSKVRLARDSLRTLQFICQAILIYNPVKLFLVLAAAAVGLGLVCLAAALLAPWPLGFGLAVGAALVALLLVGLGFVADLLRMLLGPSA